MQRSTCP